MAKEVKSSKGGIISYKCDVSKDKEVEDLFSFISNNVGGVDVCINNAGLSHNSSLLGKCRSNYCHNSDVGIKNQRLEQ